MCRKSKRCQNRERLTVVERRANGALHRYSDLPAALSHIMNRAAREWRIHFHVPIFIDRYQSLHSTQDDTASALLAFQAQEISQHLEIETYTWEVLPPDMKLDMITSIQREYEWTLSQLIPASN